MEENSEAKYLLGDVNHTAEPYSALTASNDRPPPPYNPEGSLLSQTHLQPGQPHPLQQNNPLAPYPSAPERPPPYSSGFNQPYPQQAYYHQTYQQQSYPPPPQHDATNMGVVMPLSIPQTTTFGQAKPENYMKLSLFVLLCCCPIMGILALKWSLKVDNEYNAGRCTEAREASLAAKKINVHGIKLGILFILFIIAIVIPNIIVFGIIGVP
ncbi:proline rich transmembrane protein 1B-like [Dysidea avara]|uniref:proline rich transmembrane protein 1B-like n=1 Tax=Dysidea avara TaxID=196820 RepID=UPI003329AADF